MSFGQLDLIILGVGWPYSSLEVESVAPLLSGMSGLRLTRSTSCGREGGIMDKGRLGSLPLEVRETSL